MGCGGSKTDATPGVRKKQEVATATHTSNSIKGQISITYFAHLKHYLAKENHNHPGCAKFLTLLKQNTSDLICIGGNVFGGEGDESLYTKGLHVGAILNKFGVNCGSYGKDDLNFGMEQLKENSKQCSFPWLVSNMDEVAFGDVLDGKLTSINLVTNGINLGIFGLVSQEWLEYGGETMSSVPGNDLYARASKAVASLREKETQVIIGLTDFSLKENRKLVDIVEGIDFILSSGESSNSVERYGETYIVHSYSDFQSAACIQLNTLGEAVCDVKWINVDEKTEPDENLSKMLEKMNSEVSSKKNMELCTLEDAMDFGQELMGQRESKGCTFIADVMKSFMRSDLAIVTATNLTCDRTFPKGTFALKDLLALSEGMDDNPVVTANIRGAVVREALEKAVSLWPMHSKTFPHLAGMRISFDGIGTSMGRIIEIRVDDRPLSGSQEYKVAVCRNSFNEGGIFHGLVNTEEALTKCQSAPLAVLLRRYMDELKYSASIQASSSSKVDSNSRRVSTVINQANILKAQKPTGRASIVNIDKSNAKAVLKFNGEERVTNIAALNRTSLTSSYATVGLQKSMEAKSKEENEVKTKSKAEEVSREQESTVEEQPSQVKEEPKAEDGPKAQEQPKVEEECKAEEPKTKEESKAEEGKIEVPVEDAQPV
eukprot:Nk52_evm60s236 gene=Nk52_evmTU60s236